MSTMKEDVEAVQKILAIDDLKKRKHIHFCIITLTDPESPKTLKQSSPAEEILAISDELSELVEKMTTMKDDAESSRGL
ncbi:MAG: hypothetical protein Q9174_003678 [Haloplaca sp. 1 TL-2023]